MRERPAAAVAAVLSGVGRRLINLGARIHRPPEPTVKDIAIKHWLAAEGDRTLRLDYALDRHSVVLDLGGYQGQWASDIFARYLCRIHVFEPVPDYADAIARRFAANRAITLHRLALGAADGEAELSVRGDGSSFFGDAGDRVVVRVATLESVLAAENIAEVALMKINIEGAEYDLLDQLIASGLVRRIRSLQVQFHDFVPNAESRRQAIQARLRETHRLTYEFPFIWEGWERLPSSAASSRPA